MTISPKFLGGLVLTASDQDIVVASLATTVRISSIIISNGTTGGSLTIKFYDSSTTTTRILANAITLTASTQLKLTEPIFLEENDKLIASATTTTDAQISVFGLVTPSVLLNRSGHIIQNEGSNLTQRTNLNFIGSLVSATDDNINDQTDVTIDFLSTEITGKTLVTVAPTDNLLITDASDSNNLKRIVASDLINLSSDTNPTLSNNLNIGSYAIVDTNSNEFLKFSSTASAVNEFTITNNSTGNSPKLSVTGNDTNIGLTIEAKGSGVITFNSPVNFTKTQDMGLVNVGSGVNFDQSLGNVFTRDAVNGTVTFTVSNVTTSYHIFTLLFTYTSGTINWFSGITWDGGSQPTLTGGKIYEFTFKTYNGGTNWYGAISFNN